jgi:hypothetical protein
MYYLIGRDSSWIKSHLSDPPVEFARGILGLKFDDAEAQFPTEKHLAAGIIEIAKTCDYEFGKNSIDRPKWESLIAMTLDRPLDVIQSFQDLYLGYSPEDVQIARASLSKDKKRYLRRIDSARRANNSELRIAKKRGDKRWIQRFEKNGKELDSVRESIISRFQHDHLIALRKASYAVQERRHSSVMSYFADSGDYLGLTWTLRDLDPKGLTFPLRYLHQLEAAHYEHLRKEWIAGSSHDSIMLYLQYLVPILIHSSEIGDIADKARTLAGFDVLVGISEIKTCWDSECYLAVTLVSLTQLEGLLWSFAEYLNRRNIRIFHRDKSNGLKYRPYAWDKATKQYIDHTKTGRATFAKKKEIHSARQLLLYTRLSDYINVDLWEYLVADLYSMRNLYAHGNLIGRNQRADAVASFLALWTCMNDISNTVDQRFLGCEKAAEQRIALRVLSKSEYNKIVDAAAKCQTR